MSDTPNNIVKLLTALIGPIQDVENALQQLLTERTIDTAVGVQLDVLGRVVGQARGGLPDDDYRRYLRARIATNRSNGVTEDLITIMSLVVNDSTATYDVERSGTATVVARIAGIAVTDALGSIVYTFLKSATSAGVRVVVEWANSVPANVFRLDSGPGLDQGHLASALG